MILVKFEGSDLSSCHYIREVGLRLPFSGLADRTFATYSFIVREVVGLARRTVLKVSAAHAHERKEPPAYWLLLTGAKLTMTHSWSQASPS